SARPAFPRHPAGLCQQAAKRAARNPTEPGRTVMPDNEISGAAALVTGASRGFGRGIAAALAKAGALVVGVARDRAPLEELRAHLGGSFTAVPADAADPVVAGQLIDAYRPAIVVLNAGATPLPRPVQHHTWQTFSRNWDIDVAHVFHWTREALLAPLEPGSTVVTLSSGAALFGSPLSGGYAGAKAAIRWLTAYAAEESQRAALGIRFVSVLPQLALLSEGPKYGLRLQQEFEERTGEVWPLNVGQVYITLQRLERDGLVESGGGREAGPQKRFTITPAGGAELDGWLHTPAGGVPPPRDELVIKILISLRVPGADVHDIVQVHRRHMIELMQRYWRLKAEAAEDDIGLALVADAETFRLDGIVRWLDAADARLRLRSAPDPAGRPAAAGVPAPPARERGRTVPR